MRRLAATLFLGVTLLIAARICLAAQTIARNGTAGAAATSTTFSGTAGGSLKIVLAVDYGAATVPTLPGGWTSISTGTVGSGATEIAFQMACNVSSSSGDTGTGTWTNATHVAGVSLSGTLATTTGGCKTGGIGGVKANSHASSTSFGTGSVTMSNSSGSSWIISGGMISSTETACTPLTGLTQEATVGTGPNTTIWDTEGGVSSWTGPSCTLGGASANYMYSVEVLAGGSFVPQIGYTIPGP